MSWRKPHVYTASKLKESGLWLRLRLEWSDVQFTARWPDLTGVVPDTPGNAKMFWLHDIADIQAADLVLVYASSQDDHLRGALVECGVALGLGKPVVCVSDHPDFGTWHHHPLVIKVKDLQAAHDFIVGNWE